MFRASFDLDSKIIPFQIIPQHNNRNQNNLDIVPLIPTTAVATVSDPQLILEILENLFHSEGKEFKENLELLSNIFQSFTHFNEIRYLSGCLKRKISEEKLFEWLSKGKIVSIWEQTGIQLHQFFGRIFFRSLEHFIKEMTQFLKSEQKFEDLIEAWDNKGAEGINVLNELFSFPHISACFSRKIREEVDQNKIRLLIEDSDGYMNSAMVFFKTFSISPFIIILKKLCDLAPHEQQTYIHQQVVTIQESLVQHVEHYNENEGTHELLFKAYSSGLLEEIYHYCSGYHLKKLIFQVEKTLADHFYQFMRLDASEMVSWSKSHYQIANCFLKLSSEPHVFSNFIEIEKLHKLVDHEWTQALQKNVPEMHENCQVFIRKANRYAFDLTSNFITSCIQSVSASLLAPEPEISEEAIKEFAAQLRNLEYRKPNPFGFLHLLLKIEDPMLYTKSFFKEIESELVALEQSLLNALVFENEDWLIKPSCIFLMDLQLIEQANVSGKLKKLARLSKLACPKVHLFTKLNMIAYTYHNLFLKKRFHLKVEHNFGGSFDHFHFQTELIFHVGAVENVNRKFVRHFNYFANKISKLDSEEFTQGNGYIWIQKHVNYLLERIKHNLVSTVLMTSHSPVLKLNLFEESIQKLQIKTDENIKFIIHNSGLKLRLRTSIYNFTFEPFLFLESNLTPNETQVIKPKHLVPFIQYLMNSPHIPELHVQKEMPITFNLTFFQKKLKHVPLELYYATPGHEVLTKSSDPNSCEFKVVFKHTGLHMIHLMYGGVCLYMPVIALMQDN